MMTRFLATSFVVLSVVFAAACGECKKDECKAPTAPPAPVELITLLNAVPSEVCINESTQITWNAPTAVSATFADIGSVATSGNRTFKVTEAKEYMFTLTAYNSSGASHQKEAKVKGMVCGSPPTIPTLSCRVTNGGSNSTLYVGDYAKLEASGPTGQYTWSAPGGSPPIGSGATFETRYNSPGSRAITVQASGQSATCPVHFEERPTTPNPPVHCVVSEWGPWSSWVPISATTEQRTRNRTVLVPSSNGGQSCPSLSESEQRAIVVPPVICDHSLAPETITIAFQGGNGSIAVGGSPSTCTSTLTSDAPWFPLAKGSGSGNWSSSYSVGENTATTPRTATVTAVWQDGFSLTTQVVQAGKPNEPTCSFAVTVPPGVETAHKNGAEIALLIGVNGPNPNACTWSIESTQWWAGANPKSGSGNGSSTVVISGNHTSGAQRSVEISIFGNGALLKKFTTVQGG